MHDLALPKLRGGAAAPARGASAEAPKPSAPDAMAPEERAALLRELADLQSQLAMLQGESPLILPSVDEQAVATTMLYGVAHQFADDELRDVDHFLNQEPLEARGD